MKKRKHKKYDRVICHNESDRKRYFNSLTGCGIKCIEKYTEDGKPCVEIVEDEK